MSDITSTQALIRETVAVIRSITSIEPRVGIILGTGLGGFAEQLDVEARIEYERIPHFPVSTVDAHAGELVFGRLKGKSIVAMSGRFHYYEGYSMGQITFPVRVAKALGVEVLIVSNAAGGLNKAFSLGEMMVIADHINLMGDNPLIGPNDDSLGPRFPDMSEPYDRQLSLLAEQKAAEMGIALHKGVYVAVTGPNLETRAEYRFLQGIGADVVGMSTVPEVIVAVHSGLKVLGFSVVTDLCDPDNLKPVDVDKIVATAQAAEPVLTRLVRGCIDGLTV